MSIQLFLSIITSVTAILSIVISVLTLHQSNKVSRDSQRAYISFFVTKKENSIDYELNIKNFGNSSGELLSVDISPPLCYEKTELQLHNRKILTDFTNIYLAPGQSIKTFFPFNNYPNKKLDIEVTYKTLGAQYIESYHMNLDYISSILSIKESD